LDAQGDLPFFGRQQFHKEVYQKHPRIVNDDVWTFNTQSSSQWDGLRHFGYQKEEKFYNGVTLDHIHGTNGVEKSNVNGIGAWAQQGICGRGILLDYHEWRLKQGRAHNAFETGSISAEDLRAVAKDQGTGIKFGDVLIIRSGYMHTYNQLSRAEIEKIRAKQPLTFTGIEQSDDMMEFLWSNFSAAGGDHPSLEAWPTQKDYALHEVLLAGWGFPIGELFDLEKLGAHCKKIGRWSFFLVSKPTNVWIRKSSMRWNLLMLSTGTRRRCKPTKCSCYILERRSSYLSNFVRAYSWLCPSSHTIIGFSEENRVALYAVSRLFVSIAVTNITSLANPRTSLYAALAGGHLQHVLSQFIYSVPYPMAQTRTLIAPCVYTFIDIYSKHHIHNKHKFPGYHRNRKPSAVHLLNN
jgi:hypothetical protein